MTDLEKIRERAFAIWEEEGRPEGRDVEHWLKAEAELAEKAKRPTRKPATKKPAKSTGAKAPAKPTAARRKAPVKA